MDSLQKNMKPILLAAALFFISHLHAQENYSDTLRSAKIQGAVSYLTTLKQMAEMKMIFLLKPAGDPGKEAITNYNRLRLVVDKIINQLAADSYQSNNLRLYKKLQRYLKKGEVMTAKYGYYQTMISEADAAFVELMKLNSRGVKDFALKDIFGIITGAFNMITNARDFREKKIQSIIGLMKELRLKEIKDLDPEKPVIVCCKS
jgi:hypothetical protein